MITLDPAWLASVVITTVCWVSVEAMVWLRMPLGGLREENWKESDEW